MTISIFLNKNIFIPLTIISLTGFSKLLIFDMLVETIKVLFRFKVELTLVKRASVISVRLCS